MLLGTGCFALYSWKAGLARPPVKRCFSSILLSLSPSLFGRQMPCFASSRTIVYNPDCLSLHLVDGLTRCPLPAAVASCGVMCTQGEALRRTQAVLPGQDGRPQLMEKQTSWMHFASKCLNWGSRLSASFFLAERGRTLSGSI